jgi:hypothetical protein
MVMMDKHSNRDILKEIGANADLSKAIGAITRKSQDAVGSAFKTKFGFDIPTMATAILPPIEIGTVQYAAQSLIDEYSRGVQGAISKLESSYPGAALATVQLVLTVLGDIVRSDSIGSTNGVESVQSSDDGKTNTTAVMVQTSLISKNEWPIQNDFYLSYYLLVVFPST